MNVLGLYTAATALTMDRYNSATPRPYVKPPKTKKVRANRAKNKQARSARKRGRK